MPRPCDWRNGQLMDTEFDEALSCLGWQKALAGGCKDPNCWPEDGVLVLELVGIAIPGKPVGVRIEEIRCFNCDKTLAGHSISEDLHAKITKFKLTEGRRTECSSNQG